jgi:hypothetical protein
MYYCSLKISFNSNPESFQILADEIVNSDCWLYRSVTRIFKKQLVVALVIYVIDQIMNG